MNPNADPHVCRPPTVHAAPPTLRRTWRCRECPRVWHLEHFFTEDGRLLGCSWILV